MVELLSSKQNEFKSKVVIGQPYSTPYLLNSAVEEMKENKFKNKLVLIFDASRDIHPNEGLGYIIKNNKLFDHTGKEYTDQECYDIIHNVAILMHDYHMYVLPENTKYKWYKHLNNVIPIIDYFYIDKE